MTCIAYEIGHTPDDIRADVIELLNQRLADAVDLAMQAKQAHWNAGGPRFSLFDDIHDSADVYTDLIAGRLVQLGAIAEGTVRSGAGQRAVSDTAADMADLPAQVRGLAAALARFGRRIRIGSDRLDVLGDQDASQICAVIARGVDKWLWFVETHIQAPQAIGLHHPGGGSPRPVRVL